jgi:serpin B
MGATGETAQQMSKVMKVDDLSKTALADNYDALMSSIARSSSLKIANKIYVKEGCEVKAQFNEIATKKFYSEAQTLNFSKNQESATTINEWVESKTNNKIKNLIDPSSLNIMTRMVLVNAIHFKGLWTHQFKKEHTKKEPFWVSETESVEVDMMRMKEDVKYAKFQQELDAQAIELTYNHSDVSMIILLPNQKTGLANLEAKLDQIDLAELTSKMNQKEVNVYLPRFKIEFKVQLNDHLSKVRI